MLGKRTGRWSSSMFAVQTTVPLIFDKSTTSVPNDTASLHILVCPLLSSRIEQLPPNSIAITHIHCDCMKCLK